MQAQAGQAFACKPPLTEAPFKLDWLPSNSIVHSALIWYLTDKEIDLWESNCLTFWNKTEFWRELRWQDCPFCLSQAVFQNQLDISQLCLKSSAQWITLFHVNWHAKADFSMLSYFFAKSKKLIWFLRSPKANSCRGNILSHVLSDWLVLLAHDKLSYNSFKLAGEACIVLSMKA